MKEIGLSFTVKISLARTDVHWVEEEVLRVRQEVFEEVFRLVLERIESERLALSSRCEHCGSVMVKNGRRVRKVTSLLGVVAVKRVRLRCQGCGQERYPLDEALGLSGGQRSTLGVRERALWAAVEVSYEKTHEFLEKFTGLAVSRNTVHQMALQEGRRIA
jgi:hypothetical protein